MRIDAVYPFIIMPPMVFIHCNYHFAFNTGRFYNKRFYEPGIMLGAGLRDRHRCTAFEAPYWKGEPKLTETDYDRPSWKAVMIHSFAILP